MIFAAECRIMLFYLSCSVYTDYSDLIEFVIKMLVSWYLYQIGKYKRVEFSDIITPKCNLKHYLHA